MIATVFVPIGRGVMVPIHTSSGSHSSATGDDWKVFAGIFIVMNVFWGLSWLIKLIFKDKLSDFYDDAILALPTIIMFVIWVMVILTFLGYLISKML